MSRTETGNLAAGKMLAHALQGLMYRGFGPMPSDVHSSRFHVGLAVKWGFQPYIDLPMIWKPHVTVAAIAERDGKFLLVEEETDVGIRYNQPAGHLERSESLQDAIVRETLEETGYVFVPEALVGIHHWRKPASDMTFVRFVFAGAVRGHNVTQPLDRGILAAHWLDFQEILMLECNGRLRSPLVMGCLNDWRAGRRYPLDVLRFYG